MVEPDTVLSVESVGTPKKGAINIRVEIGGITNRIDSALSSDSSYGGMSDRVPHNIDVTVPQGYNVSRIKKDYPSIHFHYVKKELWELGIIETKSPMGAVVKVYDKERCICDLIRDKKNMDMQLYTQAVKEYFKSGSNTRKILKYGKQFGVEEKLRTYMEVLS